MTPNTASFIIFHYIFTSTAFPQGLYAPLTSPLGDVHDDCSIDFNWIGLFFLPCVHLRWVNIDYRQVDSSTVRWTSAWLLRAECPSSKKKCTHYVWIKLELTLKWSMVFFSLFLTPNKSAAAARHLTAFTAYPFMFPLFQILLLKKETVINLKFENKLSQKKKQDIKLPGSWMKMLILQKLQTALSQQNVSM